MTTDRPLAGKRIVVTRAADQARSFCNLLRDIGATPICFPTIHFEPIDPDQLPIEPAELGDYRWLILTSPNAVRFFLERLGDRDLGPIKIASTGPTTAETMERAGFAVDFVPTRYTGAELAATLPDVAGARILVPRAAAGRPELVDGLRDRGAQVEDVAIYRTTVAMPTAAQFAALQDGVDVLTFTSPLTVQNFVHILQRPPSAPPDSLENDASLLQELIAKTTVACIGPTTAAEAARLGLAPQIVADEHTGRGLLASMSHFFAAHAVFGKTPQNKERA